MLRQFAFWFLDSIKGSPVKKNVSNVNMLLTAKSSSEAHQKERIDNLLSYLQKHVPFYKNLQQPLRFEDLPVVNKNSIKEIQDSFTSGDTTLGKLIPAITSGSTGTPFKVLHDGAKKTRNHADNIYFSSLAGFKIGNRLLYFKIWPKERMQSPLHYLAQNVVPIDVIQLTDNELENVRQEIEKSSGKVSFIGYVSALEELCKYLDRKNITMPKNKVVSVIGISESMTETVSEGIKKHFCVPALSRYSNLENGIIAQQIPQSGHRYLINTASYKLEILKLDEDVQAPAGQPGRIVITDLYNRALPMVRYDTGDIGILSEYTDAYGNSYLEKVEGRRLDLLFNTSGELISSYIVYKMMWKYTEIDQYQLIQETDKKYVFKICMEGTFTKENELTGEFKQYLGSDADFTIEYVKEIPLLNSGKRKKIVNLYRNQ